MRGSSILLPPQLIKVVSLLEKRVNSVPNELQVILTIDTMFKEGSNGTLVRYTTPDHGTGTFIIVLNFNIWIRRKPINKIMFVYTTGQVKFGFISPHVTAWFRQQPKEFYAAGFQGLMIRWDKCLNVQGDYVEK
jgi:hypothetical protein